MSSKPPVVLCFSGHDPSGGAGIQADIETLATHHCHACSIITALTEQDTRNIYNIIPQQPGNIIHQANKIFADFEVSVIKIGLLAHAEIAQALAGILANKPQIPVILDPVLAAGGGHSAANSALISAIIQELLPRTTLATPNSVEARILGQQNNLDESGLAMLAKGSQYVLITGTHENTLQVCNRLYHQGGLLENYTWNRLPADYHGSGCTLSACIAALLAQGLAIPDAILEAQEFTWNALQAAYNPGKGQRIPDRFFWMQKS